MTDSLSQIIVKMNHNKSLLCIKVCEWRGALFAPLRERHYTPCIVTRRLTDHKNGVKSILSTQF